MDPIKEMNIKSDEFKKQVDTLKRLEERRKTHPITKRDDFVDLCKEYEKKLEVESEYKSSKDEYKKARSLLQLDELSNRKRMLRRLQYCDDADVITQKVFFWF